MTLALLACYHCAAQPKSQKVISFRDRLPEDPCCSQGGTVWARLCRVVAVTAARLHVWSLDVWRNAGMLQKAPFLLLTKIHRRDRSQSVPKSRCARPLFSFALGLLQPSGIQKHMGLLPCSVFNMISFPLSQNKTWEKQNNHHTAISFRGCKYVVLF